MCLGLGWAGSYTKPQKTHHCTHFLSVTEHLHHNLLILINSTLCLFTSLEPKHYIYYNGGLLITLNQLNLLCNSLSNPWDKHIAAHCCVFLFICLFLIYLYSSWC